MTDDRNAPRPRVDGIDVVLVGAGERARAWLEPLRRSPRLRLVGTVARGDERLAADVEHFPSLDAALSARPGAALAVALPPRAGLEAALTLAACGRRAVVEAPLHDALVDHDSSFDAATVRVAHGWVTLAGAPLVEKAMRRLAGGRVSIDVAGLPESEHGELGESLVHGMALVRYLLPSAALVGIRDIAGGLEADLSAAEWTIGLRLRPRGQCLTVRLESSGAPLLWSWRDGRESVLLAGEPLLSQRQSAPGHVRSLAQLLPNAPAGDGLAEAAVVLRLVRDVWSRRRCPPVPGARALRQSGSIAARRPHDLLGRLGLNGDLPARASEPPLSMALRLRPEPFELWAFRAGIKPVAFLTVRPEEVESTLAWFGDVPHERCERRVRVGRQDRWTDRRDEGETRVELYISRDAALARRAAHLQAETDPTAAIREIGELVGYPACCIEAFAAQDDRANNSFNRYASWSRTAISESAEQPHWPWELNNLHTVIAPFYPCSYRCTAALTWARSALAEMRRGHPQYFAELQDWLRRPVLYFDHEHQWIFDGRVEGGRIEFTAVSSSASLTPQMAALTAAIAAGGRLMFDDAALRVEGDGCEVLHLRRTDPGLGFVAPFGGAI